MGNLYAAYFCFIMGIFMLFVGSYEFAIIDLVCALVNGLIVVDERKTLENKKEVI